MGIYCMLYLDISLLDVKLVQNTQLVTEDVNNIQYNTNSLHSTYSSLKE